MERVKRRTQLLFPPSILGFYHRLKSSLIMGTKIRKPSHAGSWYTDNRKSLKNKNFDWSNFADQIQKMGFFFSTLSIGVSFLFMQLGVVVNVWIFWFTLYSSTCLREQNFTLIFLIMFFFFNFVFSAKQLSEELEGWLKSCGLTKSPDVRGVIAP